MCTCTEVSKLKALNKTINGNAGHPMQKLNANRRGEELSGIPDVEWMKVGVFGVVTGR